MMHVKQWGLLAVGPALIGLAVAAGVVVGFGRPSPGEAPYIDERAGTVIAMTGVPLLGSLATPLVVVEFADYECPYCKVFAERDWPQLRRRLVDSGRIRFAFRQFPLTQIHPGALRAAEVAICAAEQGHFWDVHEELMRATTQQLLAFGTSESPRGLEPAALNACVATRAPSLVAADRAVGLGLGISGTPTFVVGRTTTSGVEILRKVTGAVRLTDIERMLDGLR